MGNFDHLVKTHPCLGGEAHFKYGGYTYQLVPHVTYNVNFAEGDLINQKCVQV